MKACLTLAQDVIAPQDNFTLNVYIVDDNYNGLSKRQARTFDLQTNPLLLRFGRQH